MTLVTVEAPSLHVHLTKDDVSLAYSTYLNAWSIAKELICISILLAEYACDVV